MLYWLHRLDLAECEEASRYTSIREEQSNYCGAIMRLVICTLIISTALVGHSTEAGSQTPIRKANMDMAVTSAAIAKVIISGRYLKAQTPPEVTQGDAFREHEELVMDLLYLLDRQSRPQDIRTMINLSSYYLGEAPGQILNCLIIRKGSRALSFVNDAMKATDSACEKESPAGIREKVCLTAAEMKSHLGSLAKALSSGEQCSDL